AHERCLGLNLCPTTLFASFLVNCGLNLAHSPTAPHSPRPEQPPAPSLPSPGRLRLNGIHPKLASPPLGLFPESLARQPLPQPPTLRAPAPSAQPAAQYSASLLRTRP